MTIMKVHYSPTDGIPLHSLYLKETSTTERSGSVLGGGISGDSVILGGGGYAGSEMQKTTRSTVFGLVGAKLQNATSDFFELDLSKNHSPVKWLP
ncbi:hypothetical protein AAHW83_26780 (plasmid) [Klebsiella pneumoniae]